MATYKQREDAYLEKKIKEQDESTRGEREREETAPAPDVDLRGDVQPELEQDLPVPP